VVAVKLDAENGDGLAGGGDAIDDFLRPLVLDADDDDRRDIGIATGADQRPEVKLEVGAELQAAIRMGNGDRPLDVVRDRLGRGVGKVIDRQDDHVVANAHASVLAAITPE
jgi:hypothetical protein